MLRILNSRLLGALCFVLAVQIHADEPQGAAPKAVPLPAAVQAILDESLPDEAYGATTDCVRARSVKRVEVLDKRHLLLFGSHNRAWLNRLATQCSGMRSDMIVMFDLWGSKVCQRDFAYARNRSRYTDDNFRAGLASYTSKCRLGAFEEMDHQQAEVLLQAFETAAKKRKEQGEAP